MPLMIGMRGWKSDVKGESIGKRFAPGLLRRIFGPRFVVEKTIQSHDILIRLKDIVCIEHTPQDEIDVKEAADRMKKQEEEAAKAKAEEEAKTWSHCRKCNTHSRREFDFCPKCGSALVKKEMPKPAIPHGN